MDEEYYEWKCQQDKEARLDMTQKDVDEMKDWIEQARFLDKKIEELVKCVDIKELKDIAIWLKDVYEDETGNTYDQYVQQIEEWEDYNPDDYSSDDELNQDYENEIMKGLK